MNIWLRYKRFFAIIITEFLISDLGTYKSRRAAVCDYIRLFSYDRVLYKKASLYIKHFRWKCTPLLERTARLKTFKARCAQCAFLVGLTTILCKLHYHTEILPWCVHALYARSCAIMQSSKNRFFAQRQSVDLLLHTNRTQS